MSTKDELLAALKETPAPEPVKTGLPALNGRVFARVWSAADGVAYNEAVDGIDDPTAVNAHLIAQTICDETGALLFTPDEAETLPSRNGRLWSKLLKAAAHANGFGTDEETEKNSSEPVDDSTGT